MSLGKNISVMKFDVLTIKPSNKSLRQNDM